jgi:type II secretory pathway component GspD/PulD (secretin)
LNLKRLFDKTGGLLLSAVSLFTLTFFLAALTYGVVVKKPEDSQPLALKSNPNIPRVPDDFGRKVIAALNPELSGVPSNLLDPFVERGMIGTRQNLGAPAQQAHPGASPAAQLQTLEPRTPDFASRYNEWRKKVRDAREQRSKEPPVTTVYLKDEIDPVGILDSKGEVRALLFVKPEKRTFSAIVGTRFFDCTLVGITRDGVVFETKNGQKLSEWATAGKDLPPNSMPSVTLPKKPTDLQDAVRNRVKPAQTSLWRQSEVPTVAVLGVRYEAPDSADFLLSGDNHLSNPYDVVTPGAEEVPYVDDDTSDQKGSDDHEKMDETRRSPEESQRSSVEKFCDPSYRGELFTVAQTRPITLVNLVEELHRLFGVNFVVDPESQELPIRVSVSNAPWNQILRQVIELNDLVATCNESIVRIISRAKLERIREEVKKSAPVTRQVFKLKYIQPVTGGTLNLAGQPHGGAAASIQSIEESIRRILKANGDTRGDVTRVPGRNELIVAGSEEQLREVATLIERVDRPSYQVEIKALIYTVADTTIKDYGSQLSILVANGPQDQLGGLSTLPNNNQNSGSSSGGQGSGGVSGRAPGGIPGLAAGQTMPGRRLEAPNPVGVAGFSTIVGTAQFAYQLTFAEQRGLANVQARPFGTVADGNTMDLIAGDQIPVVTTAIGGGSVVQTGAVQFLEASRVLRITPQVGEDENGKAGFITLQIQIENNSVNTALPAFGGLPTLSRQSLQTTIRLQDGETAIIGGLASDSVSKTVSKVPILGDAPLLGWLFKRKTNQEDRSKLYFAITARVIPQNSPLYKVEAPTDAKTELPPPPEAQKPPIYKKN